MKKNILIIFIILSVITFAYLNYSYSSIYNKIGEVLLSTPSDFKNYTMGTSTKTLTYVALGDSLTVGVGVDSYMESYPYIFTEKISQKNNIKINLIPLAQSGVRSMYVLNTLIEPVIKVNPDIITLFIGVNDVHGNISVKEFKNNYEDILQRLTKETNAKIYVINLPYIGTKNLIKFPYDYYFNMQTQKFNKSIEELAQKYNTEYVDLYSGFLKHDKDEAYYSLDLFHPNKKGYALWAEILYANFSK